MSFDGIDDKVPDEMSRYIISFLDVPTLVQKRVVCRSWQILFTHVIDQKAPTPKAFQSRRELNLAVSKYTKYIRADAEEFATTYGWPIGRWDVSHVQDFSWLFCNGESFNKNINSLDVSGATSMEYMFGGAKLFNQDLSSWNTSNVQGMTGMFNSASSFNQDISSWDTSNVQHMNNMFLSRMFLHATSFHQDISSWNKSDFWNG